METYSAHSERWPDPIRGPFELRFHFAVVDGRLELVGLDMRSFRIVDEKPVELRRGSGPVPLSRSMLRDLPLGRLIQEARASQVGLVRWAQAAARIPRDFADRFEAAARAPRPKSKLAKGGRPRKYGSDHWLKVAETYRVALATNRTPTRAVARAFGVPYSTAAKWVARARKEPGGLGETQPGIASATSPQRRGRRPRKEHE